MDQPTAPTRTHAGSGSLSRMSRRLEDRIRHLTARALATANPEAANETIWELRAALRQYIERLRKLAIARPLPPERRR